MLAAGIDATFDSFTVYEEHIKSGPVHAPAVTSRTRMAALPQVLRPSAFDALPVEYRELHPSYRAVHPEGVQAWLALWRQARSGPAVLARRPYPMTWERVESIRHPTLLLTGDGDLYTPPALLRMQAQHMPHADVAVIPEAGHCANWEQPDAFNRTVLDFLGRHAGR